MANGELKAGKQGREGGTVSHRRSPGLWICATLGVWGRRRDLISGELPTFNSDARFTAFWDKINDL